MYFELWLNLKGICGGFERYLSLCVPFLSQLTSSIQFPKGTLRLKLRHLRNCLSQNQEWDANVGFLILFYGDLG